MSEIIIVQDDEPEVAPVNPAHEQEMAALEADVEEAQETADLALAAVAEVVGGGCPHAAALREDLEPRLAAVEALVAVAAVSDAIEDAELEAAIMEEEALVEEPVIQTEPAPEPKAEKPADESEEKPKKSRTGMSRGWFGKRA